jgi:multidrug efflux pump subunit AcrA (membrane-fusion protein)
MRPVPRLKVLDRPAALGLAALGLLVALVAPGCHGQRPVTLKADDKPPTVQVIRPQVRNIVRNVGQPSFIEAYERTSIFAKPIAFIKEWKVDIGDKVKKGQVLATLFVPELVEDHLTKGATVVLDRERIALAEEVVRVARADVEAAEARLKEAVSILDKYEAEVERWDAEVKRLQREVDRGVVDPQILHESNHQLKSSVAARDFARATIKKADAELLSKRAALAKAEVDVNVAKADLKVAESEERRLQAWVDYLTLPAPFDGIITARNANTYDFVLPAAGDPSADAVDPLAPHLSTKGAAPIYVVDRTDIVRIFVDVPESDANYVKVGTKASVLVKGYRDEPIPGSVTRTSWALNRKSRTLRAEIDLPNTGGQLLPGMYAYAKVIIDRPDALALPESALIYENDKAYCWTLQDGRAVRTEVRTGVGDGEWIEVTNRQVALAAADKAGDPWVPITGKEQVIVGDLSLLADGVPVQVAPAAETTRLASETPVSALSPGEAAGASGDVRVSNDPIAHAETEM